MKPDWLDRLLKRASPYLLVIAVVGSAWAVYRHWYVYLPPTDSSFNQTEHRFQFEQETGIALTDTVVLLHRFHDESRGPDFVVWYVFSREPIAFEAGFFYRILPDQNDTTYHLIAGDRGYGLMDTDWFLTSHVYGIEKFISPLRIRHPISSGRAERVQADHKLTVFWVKASKGYYYNIGVQLAPEGQPFIEKP